MASVVRRLGIVGGLQYLLRERALAGVRLAMPSATMTKRPYPLYSPECSTPLWCRPFTSDRMAFAQIFIDHGYPVSSRLEPGFIVDCGANVGYSSLFFLNRFRKARLVAVEPDDRNYAVLTQNLAPYHDRVQTLRAAVWPRESGLRVSRGTYKDGLDWSTQVRECGDHETRDLTGMPMDVLLKRTGVDFVDILKMDIEGAEREVLSGEVDWLDKVGVLLIELHGPESTRAFEIALRGRPFSTRRRGEVTIAERADA